MQLKPIFLSLLSFGVIQNTYALTIDGNVTANTFITNWI